MFKKIVLDTLSFVSVKKTAADLDLSVPCIFENRHKILCALEVLLKKPEKYEIKRNHKIDETFELESQKGCRKIQRKARKRGGHHL